jgi:predicted amidophosphoribosyltransferase
MDTFEEFEKPRCLKCWAYLDFEDEVCRECGTVRGEGAFEPEDNEPDEIYGPPEELDARRAGVPYAPPALDAPPGYLAGEDPWDTGAFDDPDDDGW